MNEYLCECSTATRLLFIGLWCLADREGRLVDSPRRIWAEIFPYEPDVDVDDCINQLEQRGFVIRYNASGKKYIQITNFVKHQNPHHKEVESVIPAPDGHVNFVCDGYIPLNGKIREEVFASHPNECAYCKSVDRLQVDHIVPVSRGGNSTLDNLQILCANCNVLKRDKIVDNESSKAQGRVVLASSMIQDCVKQVASCPTDSGYRIPDSGYPPSESLNPLDGEAKKFTPSASEKYCFIGRVIKLTREDRNKWDEAYRHINVIEHIASLDEHYAKLIEKGVETDESMKKSWFFRTANALANSNQNRKLALGGGANI